MYKHYFLLLSPTELQLSAVSQPSLPTHSQAHFLLPPAAKPPLSPHFSSLPGASELFVAQPSAAVAGAKQLEPERTHSPLLAADRAERWGQLNACRCAAAPSQRERRPKRRAVRSRRRSELPGHRAPSLPRPREAACPSSACDAQTGNATGLANGVTRPGTPRAAGAGGVADSRP